MTKTIRNMLLAGGAALILSTGIAAAAPATAESDVNMRSGPGPEYPVVGVLRAGETVDVAGCTGSWCRVRGPSGAGFASRNYLAMAGGVPSVGVAVTPGYVEGGYAYNDYPGYGYDDYHDYGYDYGSSVGFYAGGRFGRRDFDRDRRWNGGRVGSWSGTGGTWQGNRTGNWQGGRAGTWQANRGGNPQGAWQGRANVSSNRVGAAPGSVTPMSGAQTGLQGGASVGGGSVGAGSANVGASAGGRVGGGGRDRH